MTPSPTGLLQELEFKAYGKLQLTHRIWRLQRCNVSIVAASTIDTSGGTLVSAESVHRVVKDIECIHAELGVNLFRNLESLYEGHIRIEPRRSMK